MSCRSQALEMSQRSVKPETSSSTQRQVKSQSPLPKRSYCVATSKPTCGYCHKDHYLFKCETFLKLSPTNRYSEALQMKLCTNCLKFRHFKQECRSMSSCFKCKRRHNTLLHQNEEQLSDKNSQQNIIGQSSACLSIQRGIPRQILLPTATVMVYDRHGNMHKARALLDSGSQPNFITKHLAE